MNVVNGFRVGPNRDELLRLERVELRCFVSRVDALVAKHDEIRRRRKDTGGEVACRNCIVERRKDTGDEVAGRSSRRRRDTGELLMSRDEPHGWVRRHHDEIRRK